MSVQNFAANVSIGLQQVIEGLSFMKSSKELMGEIDHDSSVINVDKVEGEEAPFAFTTKNLSLNFPNGEKLTFPDIDVKPGRRSY